MGREGEIMQRWSRSTAAALALLLLAACTSLSLDTAARLRALDYLNDDIASLVLAFDVPEAIEPVADGSTLSFDITTPGNGERHIRAVLARAEAGEIAGSLPPPAGDRTYYLFGFSDADKAQLREAQAWARTLPTGNNSLAIGLAPRFCRTAAVDPANVRISVLIALPGTTSLAPLINGESLANLLAQSPDKTLPECAGHSG